MLFTSSLLDPEQGEACFSTYWAKVLILPTTCSSADEFQGPMSGWWKGQLYLSENREAGGGTVLRQAGGAWGEGELGLLEQHKKQVRPPAFAGSAPASTNSIPLPWFACKLNNKARWNLFSSADPSELCMPPWLLHPSLNCHFHSLGMGLRSKIVVKNSTLALPLLPVSLLFCLCPSKPSHLSLLL